MNQELINQVMHHMKDTLDNRQLMKLKHVLEDATREDTMEDNSRELLERFLNTKRLEGRSERTVSYYQVTAEKMLDGIGKSVLSVGTDDLRKYLSDYQSRPTVSKQTVDNVRRNLSSFFNWLEDEGYILKSPAKRIRRIKTTTVVKEAYSDEEMEKLREACKDIRDLAIVDLLASTGMRIGELVQLNREDIDFNERE